MVNRTLRFLLIVSSLTYAHAQYELPNEIYERTLLIRSGSEMSTAFKFDLDGRVYLVTSRHVAEDLPLKNATVQVWHGSWIDLPTVQTFFPSAKDVDLAILETDEKIGRPYKVVKSSEVLTTGQKVWYMGWIGPIPRFYPPAYTPKTLRPLAPEIPMVKIATISSIDPTRSDSFEFQVEGGYNLRIAPGPIVYWSPVHRDYEILGLIARNGRDAVKSSSGAPPQKVVKLAPLRGYSIDLVSDTILGK